MCETVRHGLMDDSRPERETLYDVVPAAISKGLSVLQPDPEVASAFDAGELFSREHLGAEQAEKLERAVGCYEAALCIYSEAWTPHEWVRTQNNLGNAYGMRLLGDRAENLVFCQLSIVG